MINNKHIITHKKANNLFVVISCMVFLIGLGFYYINLSAESAARDKETEDLNIYDSSSGFYEVPMSTNVIPANEKTVEYPTMAITDTLILKDESSDSSGLSIYKLSTRQAVAHARVGNGYESTYDVKAFGVGDFTAIKTSKPYQCSELTLTECISSSAYINEKLFSISIDGISDRTPSVTQINATTTSVATTTVVEKNDKPADQDGILVIASTTRPVETQPDPVQIILDTINSAESTLVLPSEDLTPEVTLDSLLKHSEPADSPLLIQHNYSNNEEVKNADF